MSDKNFDPGMKDTCELKEAWADGKKLYYVEDIPGLLEQIACLNKQLEKANESVAELEHEKESLNMRVSKQKEVIKRYAKEAIETAKAQEAFAIENQIKGATLFSSSANETGQFGWSDCQWLSDYAEEFAEQLRKEQDSE
ncbi:hypothetical protein KUL150_11310 [Alteromonas sp. KUL150]|uniref:hypothetical protein n=1 Tax=Alteromonas sp. KUL150 TaxID=2480805 RepID=UPI0012E59CFE|nr:hypothetical protein [Alteromonas sp. KUL150]GFD85072.1 hypothetical protein KUL150_11310 [Alteromonas sp. KUL150]